MKFKSHPAVLMAFLFAGTLSQSQSNLHADNWPQFLGAQRNGISSETGLLDNIPAGGPKVLWKVPGGVGMSAVSVVDQYAITTWNESGKQSVVALNPENGKTIWATPIGTGYENSMGNGPRATPAIVGDRVYAYGGAGELACLNLADGKVIWSANVPREVKGKTAEYGVSSSPLVVDGKVIVTCGGAGAAVVAFDAKSGTKVWSAIDGASGYSSVSLLKILNDKQLVSFTGAGASGLDVSTGKVRWEYPFKTAYDCNTASPINVGENVLISAGENHGSVMLKFAASSGGVNVTEEWESVNTKSVLRNEWQTSVLINGHLYGFDNVGSAGPITHLVCVNAATGMQVWRETRFGKGNLTAADGKLWITMMSGELILVKATPDKYVELGRAKLFGKTRQSLSISNGRGYIRDDQNVVCFDLRK